MTVKEYAQLAAAIFAIIAVIQLVRAIAGWPVTIDTLSIPLWASWIVCAVAGVLAWLGFSLARD